MPVLDGKLTGDQGGAALIAILQQFKQIPALLLGEGRQPEVVEDEQIGVGKVLHQFAIPPITFREGKFRKEFRQPGIACR